MESRVKTLPGSCVGTYRVRLDQEEKPQNPDDWYVSLPRWLRTESHGAFQAYVTKDLAVGSYIEDLLCTNGAYQVRQYPASYKNREVHTSFFCPRFGSCAPVPVRTRGEWRDGTGQ
jgi:hypothetical protein